jgi:tRNA pseudouridine13 synthase
VPRISERAEDFLVDEVALYAPAGRGEHTLVRVEKRDLTTSELVRRVAARLGLRPREIGYAGRKDRRAVTRQWLSIPRLAPERAREIEDERVRVLEAARHLHKLRLGDLLGNRFEILVRDVDSAQAARGGARLAAIRERGLPNRFGPQRFGRDGTNAERGREILACGRVRGDPRAAGLLLSAFQAEVFNRVLDERRLPLEAVEEGDWVIEHRSGGMFLVRELEREQRRAQAFELSVTGPLFGTHMPEARGLPGERERRAFEELSVPPAEQLAAFRGLRLRGGRRALRVRVDDLAWEAGESTLRLRFTLAPGSYATVLLDEVFGPELARGAPE